MTAIGLTGFGLLIKLISFSPVTVVSLLSTSVCLGLICILFTAFLVIDKYYWQTNSDRYHFLNINAPVVKVLGNSWMWFYHGVKGISDIPFTTTDTGVKEKEAGAQGI